MPVLSPISQVEAVNEILTLKNRVDALSRFARGVFQQHNMFVAYLGNKSAQDQNWKDEV